MHQSICFGYLNPLIHGVGCGFGVGCAAIVALGGGLGASPAIASPQIEIEYGTDAFQNQELTDGAVTVSVSYFPYSYTSASTTSANLRYQIYYNDTLHVEASESTNIRGSVALQDLDNNGVSEVIVETYSGGAHCCTNFSVYSWQTDQFTKTETGWLDASGGQFEDLNDDGAVEFVTADNAFLYAFSSYAASFPPSLVFSFQNGQFETTTSQYRPLLESTAWQMYQTFLRIQEQNNQENNNEQTTNQQTTNQRTTNQRTTNQQNNRGVNGVLAGYVAQKILLGEYQEGWEFMLATYDRSSRDGLEIYDTDGNVVSAYPDFPTALRSFLIELGYLNANGQPNSFVDRSPQPQ